MEKASLILMENGMSNLSEDMEKDTRCKPKYKMAIDGYRETIKLILESLSK